MTTTIATQVARIDVTGGITLGNAVGLTTAELEDLRADLAALNTGATFRMAVATDADRADMHRIAGQRRGDWTGGDPAGRCPR